VAVKRTIGFAAAVVTVVVAAFAAPSAYAAKATPSETALLFSTLASTSAVTVSAHSTSITLPGNSPTTWFTDRPVRKAGTITVGELAIQWKSLGFASAPPNAAIVMHENDRSMQVAVTLSNPRIFGSLVTFTTKKIASGSVLGMSSQTSMRAGIYGATEIFIDGGTQGSTSGLTLKVVKVTTYAPDCSSATTVTTVTDENFQTTQTSTQQQLTGINMNLCVQMGWGGTSQTLGSIIL